MSGKRDPRKARGLGRPRGSINQTPLEKILRSEAAMLEALHQRATTGEPQAVRLCLELIGRLPSLPVEAVPPEPQSTETFIKE